MAMPTSDGENYADVDAAAASSGSASSAGREDHLDPAAAAYDDDRPLDARDERVSDDPFAPPKMACECYCLHCQRTFMSTAIWFQRIKNAQPGKFDGFWMCPTPNCDGKGFTFDIYPTDPDHPANEGWSYDDDEDDEEDYEGDDEEEWDPEFGAATTLEDFHTEYDPAETKWKQLDEELGEDDDDIEGDEWKYGLQPGESLPEPDWLSSPRRDRERRYDQPDERPREIEWDYRDEINEDDIPF